MCGVGGKRGRREWGSECGEDGMSERWRRRLKLDRRRERRLLEYEIGGRQRETDRHTHTHIY
jgi:hypothetical protein